MSKRGLITLNCPKCHDNFEKEVWQSINVTIDPDLKKELKDYKFFLHTCPKCGFEFVSYYNFLYHDMENQFMVSLCDDLIEMSRVIDVFEESKGELAKYGSTIKDTRVRVTTDERIFREKILLFENGFDDRIVEIYKLITIMNAYKMSEKCGLLVETIYGIDRDSLDFALKRIGKKKDFFGNLSVKVYENIKKDYEKQIINEDDYLINAAWAIEKIRETLDKRLLEVYERNLLYECEYLWTYEGYVRRLKDYVLHNNDDTAFVKFIQIFNHMPVAIPIHKEDGERALLLAETEKGNNYIIAFINEKTMAKSECKYDDIINLTVIDALDLVNDTNSAGIILEPFNEPYVFSKEILEIMLKNMNKKKG